MESKVDPIEKQVEHLLNISSLLPKQMEGSNILKSLYLLKCKEFFIKNKVILPAKFIKHSNMCKYCSNIWIDGNYSIKISNKKPGKKVRNLLEKRKEKLTKFEKKLLSKLKTSSPNQIIIKCLLCKKLTKIPCLKNLSARNVNQSKQKNNDSINKKENEQILNITNTSTPKHTNITPNNSYSEHDNTFDRKKNFQSKYKVKLNEMKKQIKNQQTPKKSSTPNTSFTKNNKLKKLLTSAVTPKNSKNSLKSFLGSL